jgi:N-acetylglucosaminyl-diphospho-decaprenol L-rhamnosyltransferase
MLRSAIIAKIGLLDERFFAYFEDMDYCLAARRKGWETWYVPQSRIIHFEGASSGVRPDLDTRPPAYWFQARRRYFLKNGGMIYTILTDGALITGCAIGWFYAIIRRRNGGSPLVKLKDSIRHSVFVAGLRA